MDSAHITTHDPEGERIASLSFPAVGGGISDLPTNEEWSERNFNHLVNLRIGAALLAKDDKELTDGYATGNLDEAVDAGIAFCEVLSSMKDDYESRIAFIDQVIMRNMVALHRVALQLPEQPSS